jgi:hypothetical protein
VVRSGREGGGNGVPILVLAAEEVSAGVAEGIKAKGREAKGVSCSIY